MSFIWNEKHNFILLHSIILHQQQTTIDWSTIAKDIHLEILSTPFILKKQYEYLIENFCSKHDTIALYIAVKQTYLHSLCRKIENHSQMTLEIVYEFIRHIRSKRLSIQDIEQLITEWNFNFSSDEEQNTKERLCNVLNRLRYYIQTLSDNNYQSKLISHANTNETIFVEKTIHDTMIECVPSKQNYLVKLPHKEKTLFTRRRTRSLTILPENKDDKVNIGVEWFVPKFKRQQRSSSLHSQCSLLPNRRLESNEILLTTIDNDESSNSTDSSHNRQKHISSSTEQVAEKEKLLDDQHLDNVSSTDSDSIEVQWSSSISHPITEHHRENSSAKRQRLA